MYYMSFFFYCVCDTVYFRAHFRERERERMLVVLVCIARSESMTLIHVNFVSLLFVIHPRVTPTFSFEWNQEVFDLT